MRGERGARAGALDEIATLDVSGARGDLLRQTSLRAQTLERACKPVAGTVFGGIGGSRDTPRSVVGSRNSSSSSQVPLFLLKLKTHRAQPQNVLIGVVQRALFRCQQRSVLASGELEDALAIEFASV
jgi:hypothetical protein